MALSTFDLWRRKLGATPTSVDEEHPEALFVELTNSAQTQMSPSSLGPGGWKVELELGAGYAKQMRIIAKRTLRTYWDRERGAQQPLKSWFAIATKADWSSPADVKATYGNASIVGGDRVVFNIGGNRYRLIVRFDYERGIGFVRFVGTHAEYDRIDASSV